MKKDAVILIPSFEPGIELINTAKSLYDLGFSILIINDGSKKEFDSIFEQVYQYCKYIKYDINVGKGGALKAGFSKLKELFPEARYVITVDGDGQHDKEDVVKIYQKLKEDNEIALGVRKLNKNIPLASLAGNNMSKITRFIVSKKYLPDDQCGLRGFPIRYIDELLKISGSRYEYEMNQVVYFQLRNYEINTIVIKTIYQDNNSATHFRPIKDTILIQKTILLQGFTRLICFGILLAALLLFYINNITLINLIGFPVYLAVCTIYSLIHAIIHRSKNILKTLSFEYGISFAKSLLFVGAMIGLSYTKISPVITVTLSVFIITFLVNFALYFVESRKYN